MGRTINKRNEAKRIAGLLFAEGVSNGAIVLTLAKLKRGAGNIRAFKQARERWEMGVGK